MRMFADHAAEAIAAELELHGALVDEPRIPGKALQPAEPASTNLAHASALAYDKPGGVDVPADGMGQGILGSDVNPPRLRV